MNRTISFTQAVLLASGLLCLAGCKKTIDPNDKTPPVAEIKIKDSNGQYSAPPANLSMSVSTGQVDALCTVSDAEGVKSAQLEFVPSEKSCTTNTGGIYSGVPMSGLPSTLSQTLSGDAQGKVIDKLPLFATVKGPLTCTVPPNQPGAPIGVKVILRCSGTNWASDPTKNKASVDVPIALK